MFYNRKNDRGGCVINKTAKGCLIGVVSVIGFIFAAIVFLFSYNSYTSPVRKAGRDYRSEVKAYRNKDIESIEDVYERMDLLRKHFNSPTHSKMQGGEKTEITIQDIETMFGEADEVIEDVNIDYTENVYQYKYEEKTLNIHERWREVEEYVFEDYSGERYHPQTLDVLFFKAVKVHQTDYKNDEAEFESFPETDISEFITDKDPTREISQSGWFVWPMENEKYFDDGNAKYSPEEFLMLEIRKNDQETNELTWMKRRYRDSFVKTTEEETDKRRSKLNEWSMRFKQIEDENLDEIVTVEDLSNDFGEMTQLTYNFRDGVFTVHWIIFNENTMDLQVNGDIAVSADNIPTTIEEMNQLEVIEISSDQLSNSSTIVEANGFIGR